LTKQNFQRAVARPLCDSWASCQAGCAL